MYVSGFDIIDWSIGGLETCIVVKNDYEGLNIGLDVGTARNELLYVDSLFISHGHPDHCASLTNALGKRYVGNKNNGSINPNLTAYAPQFIRNGLEEAVTKTLSVGCSDHFLTHLILKSVNLNSAFDLGFGWLVKPFRSTHSIPCYGYLFYYYSKPTLAYTGDTTFSVFSLPENKDLLSVRVLIMEISGWNKDDPDEVKQVHASGHIHIKDVIDSPQTFENVESIVAFHIQPKYTIEFILSVVSGLPDRLDQKVYPCLTALEQYQVSQVQS